MATFIPQVQANLPEVKLYTPPFEMIANFLDVKQQRYDAAATQLGSYYSRLKQLPLTAESNIEKRDQFLKEAEAQVKRLAEVDLSLPENYKAARNIFNPLLEDQDIMTDLTFTLNAQAMIRANDAFKNSSEEEDRKRYNPNNNAYASLKLNEFRMADSETRSAMAKEQFSFVNNVNLFQKYLDITKGMDFEIDTTKVPTTKSGGLMPFYVKTKNGKEITPTAYARLARVFNQDPDVKAYYAQQGYVTVQSELQSLIPEIGYEAALAQVSGKYESSASIQKALKAAQDIKAEIETNEKKKTALESKIRKNGVVPGSKAHREYLEVLADLDRGVEEHANIIEEAKGLPLVANNLSQLYSQAGDYLYENDLMAAATDYAVRNSSFEIAATPNYGKWVDLRNGEGSGSKKASGTSATGASDGTGLLSTDTAPITYTGAEPTKKTTSQVNSERLAQRQEEINVGLVGVVASYTREHNLANPDEQADVKFENTGIRDAETAQAWYQRVSESSTKGQQLQEMTDYLDTLVKNGSLEELYPKTYELYMDWKNQSKSYVKGEQLTAKSYAPSVKSSRTLDESDNNLSQFTDLYDILYDENTGIKSKAEFDKAISIAADNGTLPPALQQLQRGAVKPSGNLISQVASEFAEDQFMQALSPQDRVVNITDESGNVIGKQTAWEALSDKQRYTYAEPFLRSYRMWERNPSLRGSDGEDFVVGSAINQAAKESMSYNAVASRWYDRAVNQINNYYEADPKSKSITNVLNPGAVSTGGAADALEFVSTNLDLKPASELSEVDAEQQELLLDNIRTGLQSGDITIKSGKFDNEDVEAYEKGRLTGDKNQERVAFRIFENWKTDLNTAEDAKSSSGTASPRATFKVLPSVPLDVDGRKDNTTIVEITYNDGYLRSITSTSENPGLKTAATDEVRHAVLFIPEDYASQMNIPRGSDIESFNSFVLNTQYELNFGGNSATLIYNEDEGTISFNQRFIEMNPETGQSKLVEGMGDIAVPADALNFKMLKMQLSQKLKELKVRNEQIESKFNESQGAVNDPEALK